MGHGTPAEPGADGAELKHSCFVTAASREIDALRTQNAALLEALREIASHCHFKTGSCACDGHRFIVTARAAIQAAEPQEEVTK